MARHVGVEMAIMKEEDVYTYRFLEIGDTAHHAGHIWGPTSVGQEAEGERKSMGKSLYGSFFRKEGARQSR